MTVLIESVQNKLVKKIKSLQQRKNRDKEGVFIVEGIRFVGGVARLCCFSYISKNK